MKKSNTLSVLAILLLATFVQDFAGAMSIDRDASFVDFSLGDLDLQNLSQPKKTSLPEVAVKIVESGRLVSQRSVKLSSRGQSSIKHSRKNLEIDSLKITGQLHRDALSVSGLEGNEIILSAAAEDPLAIKNMIVYRIYEAAGVPSLETAYTEVRFNGNSRGLYVVTRSPVDHLFDQEKAQIVFRRTYYDRMELKKAKKNLSIEEVAEYQNAAKSLFTDLKKYKGQELIDSLNKKINLDHYLRMLAVNYIVRNSDYVDEIHFFGKRNRDGEIYFDVLPWDLDNTFIDRMHFQGVPLYSNNGHKGRSKRQMLFSFESRLDQAISEDPILLNKYFEILGKVTADLSNHVVESVGSEVQNLLLPYLDNSELLATGILDPGAVAYTKDGALKNLRAKIEFLKREISLVRAELTEASKHPQDRAKRMSQLKKKIGLLQQKYF